MSGKGSKSVAAPSSLEAFEAIDQSALDAIPTGFCVCRADGGLIRFNQRAAELWGRTPRLGDPGEQSGANFRRYGPAGEALHFDSTPVAQALRSGERITAAEL